MNDLEFKKNRLEVLFPSITIEKAENGYLTRCIKEYVNDLGTSREIVELFEDNCEEKAFIKMCWSLIDHFQICNKNKRIAINLVNEDGQQITND